MSALPKGWKEVQIKDLSPVIGGGTPSTSKKEYFDGDIAWVTPADLSGYREMYISRGRRNITKEGLEASSARVLPKGSVIYSTRAPIGYVAIAGNPLATNQGFKSILPSEKYDSKYVYYYLKSIKAYAESEASGTTFKELSGKKFGELKFPLAPLPEQKLIVAKLDTLFAHLDQLRARLDKIPVLLKQFRQAVLMQAVTGKLTEEWRGKSGSRFGDYVNSNEVSPFKLPQTWKFVQLREVCEKFTYGTSSKSQDKGQVVVLRMGNIQNGKIDWSDLKFTSDKDEIAKYSLKTGEVLFNRTNSPELVGKSCVYDGKYPAIYAGYLIKIWSTAQLDPYYLNIVLNSPYGRDWSWRSKSDGVSQSNINAKKLAAFEIPFPPIKEQKRIVDIVQSLFATAYLVEGSCDLLKVKIANLPLGVLSKAFRGELVNEQIERRMKVYSQTVEDLSMAAEPKDEY